MLPDFIIDSIKKREEQPAQQEYAYVEDTPIPLQKIPQNETKEERGVITIEYFSNDE